MNVLMINNEFPPLGGGTATVNANLLDAFVGDDSISIELVTSSGGAPTSITNHGTTTRIHRIKVKRQASPHHATILDLLSFMISALPYCVRLKRQKKFDLIFAWATMPSGLLAWLLGRISGTPYIVRVSGPDIPGWEKRYALLTRALAPLLRMVWRGAVFTTAKSEQERAAVLQSCAGLKIELLPTAVPCIAREPRKRDGAAIRLLCVARLIARKRHELLLRALALLPSELPWSISFVGTGDEERRLRTIANELSLADKVVFRGYVDREKIAEIYSEHDIFISLSENESMSVAALEALASGMPCLLSHSAACGLPLDTGVSLLGCDDALGLAAEIANALRDVELLKSSALPRFLPLDMARVYKESIISALARG